MWTAWISDQGPRWPHKRRKKSQLMDAFAQVWTEEFARSAEEDMRHRVALRRLEPKNPCPVCGLETALTEIEAHPLHATFEIHGYSCADCGPIKSLVVRASAEKSLRVEGRPRYA